MFLENIAFERLLRHVYKQNFTDSSVQDRMRLHGKSQTGAIPSQTVLLPGIAMHSM